MDTAKNYNKIRIATLGNRKQTDLIIYNGCQDTILPPGNVIGPIIRDFHVIKYCTSGKGTIYLNDAAFSIQEGQCFVAFPGDIMIEVADTEDPWSHTWVTIDGIKATLFFKNIGMTSENPVFPWRSNRRILNKLTATVKACENFSRGTELKRIGCAYSLFDELTSFYQQNTDTRTVNAQDDYINEAIYYMEMNCSHKIKIADVAAHIGLNRSYFFSIFKAYTNLSPQEYLTRLRMNKACELFAFPQATVASVANSLGYDSSAFFRHFKRIMGISPSEYKEHASR